MNTFMGLEIGKRSIMTHQVALDVTGHNIANANTPGYSRQAANIVTDQPFHTPVLIGNDRVGQLGMGSQVTDIQRYRDSFIDDQIRNEVRTAGYWQSMQEGLAQIEGILNEPSEEGLRGVMDKFWESWQDLSVNPESEASRSVINERAMGMTESFNHAFRQLTELRDDVNSSVKIKTDVINSIALQIRDLNKQILAITIAGKQPNDLLDKRDLLVDQLSGLADIRIFNEPNAMFENNGSQGTKYNGVISIQLGGRTMVQGGEVCQLAVEADEQGMNLVVWADTRMKARIDGGELRGLLDMRGKTHSSKERNPWEEASAAFSGPSEYKETIPTMINNLNTLARTIIQRTNDIHHSGYSLNNKTEYPDGNNFFVEPDLNNFDGNWARIFQVDSIISNDIRNITAASNRTWNNDVKVNFGDGSNALKIAQLKQSLNHPEYTVQTTEDLDTGAIPFLQFPSNSISGYITISYQAAAGTDSVSIFLAPPAKPYQDLQQLATAIQQQLNDNDTLKTQKIFVDLRCDGKKLSFFSGSDKFRGINDGNAATIDGTPGGTQSLLGGSSFSLLPDPIPPNPLVQDATNDDYWRGICAKIGVESQEAQRLVKNQDQLIGELENKRQSLSGVSLDEEMTNMIKFQHAYNAASRFITTIDEQLQTIINGMGLVGR